VAGGVVASATKGFRLIFVQLAIGLLLLLGGGEALVKGAVAIARRLGLSPLVIGLTLVGFGTSTPELVASLQAALRGSPGIALGNVVGSNIVNIVGILGLTAVILPVATTREAFRRDGAALVGVTLLMCGLILFGTLPRSAGILLLVLLLAYTVGTYLGERNAQQAPSAARRTDCATETEEALPPRGQLSLARGVLLAVGGIAAVVFGADLLVGAAIVLARTAGLSEAVIGLTLVAFGTSLPELVTSVTAAVRRHTDVAFGNVVGSNIFNILGIAGATAVLSPIAVPPEIARFDVWVMTGAALLLVLFAVTGWRVNRWEGGVFLAAYGLYLAVQFSPGARVALGLS